MTQCTLLNNAGGEGGAMYSVYSFPSLTGCTFSGNSANLGGAMANDQSFPSMVNCVFGGNSASTGGGAIYNRSHASPSLTNCTLGGNVAGRGGAIYNSGSSGGWLLNCILWGNQGGSVAESQIAGSRPSVRYSLVQGGWAGLGILNTDPLFVRAPSASDPGDLRLLPGSPAADAGKTAILLASMTVDIDGHPRVQGFDVDMGAYEQTPDRPTYQAEQATVQGAIVSSARFGFTGTGYVDYMQAAGDFIEFRVDVTSVGRYELTFRYATAASRRGRSASASAA